MKKSKQSKTKKIHTTRSEDAEKDRQVRELVKILQVDQMKTFLRKYYKYIQDYEPEVVMEALDKQWSDMHWSEERAHSTLISSDEQDISIQAHDPVSGHILDAQAPQGFRHNPEETLKNNAAFLIASSEKIDYNQETLAQMKASFERGAYDDVLDQAYLHDRHKRCISQSVAERTDTKQDEWKERLINLVSEIEIEEDEPSDIIHCLVCALREMDGQLTYESRALAKEYIKKALRSKNGQKTRQNTGN